MKVSMIVGVPCSGKSTLVRRVVNDWCPIDFKAELVVGHTSLPHVPKPIIVIGDYSDPLQQFPGTDRLSMAVMPQARTFIEAQAKDDVHIIFEGDRLGGKAMVEWLDSRFNFELFAMDVAPSVLSKRREAVGRTQPEPFLKRCETKVRNSMAVAHNITLLTSNTQDDLDQSYKYLMRRLDRNVD